MPKRNKKQAKRLRNLIVTCSLFAILLTVSTYAWFIGMKTVNVTTFDIDIATTEGLFLSMDGSKWSYKLDAKGTPAYVGHTNTWAEDGLIPMSTVGDMDPESSRMKLFEKASLTTTPGGYRLLTSRVDNYTESATNSGELNQGKGYVAFDLFIKNLSGNAYYVEDNEDNEEAIYLTTNSKVEVASGGVDNTGIENSVRVAFAQVGRVKADTTDASNITEITCDDVAASDGQVQVTGICRSAQIWEPNDTKHVKNAISWYETACLQRTATASYATDVKCATVTDDENYSTYAISRPIEIADYVDVYDGAAYNSFTNNTIDYETYAAADENGKKAYKLVDFPYFTDTMKDLKGMDRPQFMTLAPNSITKVRVYVYIEGQDIDNYDFASLGKQISVNFGFTKERFTEEDIPGYDGPSIDITPTESDDVATEGV